MGDEITLTATAAEGFIFQNWRKDGVVFSSDSEITYTMPAGDVTLTAYFVADDVQLYTLSLVANPVEGGNVSGGGQFIENEEVTISAVVNDGYLFVNWTNGETVVSTDASYTFTMPAENLSLTANFEEIPTYTLTLAVNPVDAGTVTGAGEYEAGVEVAITAVAAEGYEFVNWTDADGNEVSVDADFTYTMPNANTTLTANFKSTIFTLTLIANPADAGTVTGAGDYNVGTEVALTAVAEGDYVFANWTDVDGVIVSDVADFTYTMPEHDVTLTANFMLADQYQVIATINPAGVGAGVVAGTGFYFLDEEVTLEATANEGFEFVNWTDTEGTELSTEATYVFSLSLIHISEPTRPY